MEQIPSRSLLEVLNKPKVALTSCFLLVLIVCTLIGNFLVIWTIWTTRRLRFSAFFFIASLAAADFLVGLVVLPISLAYYLTFEMEGRWIFGSWTCKAWLLANFWFCSASVLNLCLVSWDRYVAVTSPLRYKLRMSGTKVRKMILISWTLSFSVAIVSITGIHLKNEPTLNCTIQGKFSRDSAIVFFTVMFFLPILFLTFVNGKLWFATRRQNKRIQTEVVEALRLGCNASISVQENADINSTSIETARSSSVVTASGGTLTRTIRQEIKMFKTFLIVIGVFVVCWCPFYVCIVVASFKPLKTSIFYLSVILSYCNSAVNIIIYGIFSREFRRAVMSKVTGLICKTARV